MLCRVQFVEQCASCEEEFAEDDQLFGDCVCFKVYDASVESEDTYPDIGKVPDDEAGWEVEGQRVHGFGEETYEVCVDEHVWTVEAGCCECRTGWTVG